MTASQAWQWIFNNMNSGHFQKIPAEVREHIKIDSRAGLGGGMFITEEAFKSSGELTKRINGRVEKLA